MGIFSKFQIKDIKSKILGGKVKHKAELVPAIAVIPPTPSQKSDFTFPGDDNLEETTTITNGRQAAFRKITRQRSYSLPGSGEAEQTDSNAVEQQVEEIDLRMYLKLPKPARRKRRNHKRRRSCPESLSEGLYVKTDIANCSKIIDKSADGCSKSDGPMLSTGYELSSQFQSSANEPKAQEITENQEFRSEEEQQANKLFQGTACRNNLETDSNHSTDSWFGSDNGMKQRMDASPFSDECNEAGETTPLCLDDTGKFEESSKVTLGESIRRRVAKSYKSKPERWSLDLERLLTGRSDNSIDENNEDLKWDGHASKMSPKSNGKGLISTWSLDLESETNIKNGDVERTRSEMNIGGSPMARDRSVSHENGVFYNAKSLDLDLGAIGNVENEERSSSTENMLRTTSLKKGINGYIGKFNGIVSKFSTWSLDIEVNRKRSLDDLNESNRAQSETLLDATDTEPKETERSLSYHALLYDIDEASRYQIYQPTVYDIGDEGGANDRPDRHFPGAKSGQYANSMKFLSKQFGNLYENGKNLYKHSYAIVDAIKQREKELKAIADRQSAEKVHTEQIFKPKSSQRQRSNSGYKQKSGNAM